MDAEGRTIEGVRGVMHRDVLTYMKEVGPRSNGDYLIYANSGRLRYILFDE